MELKLTIRTDRLTAPKLPAYKPVGDYNVSKYITKSLPKQKCSEDIVCGNVAVNLSIARRQLKLTEERLSAKRAFERQQREALDAKWEELEDREQQLRTYFVEFNAFVKENEEKRNRAFTELEKQKELLTMRTKNTNDLLMQYNEVIVVKKLMMEKLEEYNVFERFLQNVADEYPEYFTDTLAIIKRYETLIHAKKILSTRQQLDLNILHDERAKLVKQIDSYHQRLTAMHTKVAGLRTRYALARFDSLRREQILTRIKEETTSRTEEVVEVRTTCDDLYKLICTRMHNTEPIYLGDYKMELEVIKKALYDVRRVNQKVGQLQREAAEASDVPMPSTRRKGRKVK